MQELVSSNQQAGSTALIALMVDSHLHIANVGDCRAVVVSGVRVVNS